MSLTSRLSMMLYLAHLTWAAGAWPSCSLCKKKGTLENILSCCLKALGEGRYLWWYNQTVAERMGAITSCRRSKHTKNAITFVRAREKPRITSKAPSGHLTHNRTVSSEETLTDNSSFPSTLPRAPSKKKVSKDTRYLQCVDTTLVHLVNLVPFFMVE